MAQQQHKSSYLDTGVMFEGKYRIVRELGRGGFGMVYLAHQEQMDRHVAIKVLRSGMGRLHHSAKERFLREVKIISKLRHPNTVTIHDFGETADGVLYMVLEFIEGHTVKSILKNEGAQPPRRALALAGQITRSLAEAHRHGVIHRDLKPANIMVTDLETETDFVKVLDFGIARLLRTDERDLTSVGLPEGERELIGTPRYMSPEQVRGEALGPASDVYSVGLILYEMLVGQPAVQGDTTMALISQQISPQPLRLDGLRVLPPQIADLIRRATAKNLAQRFPDAETFGDAIDQTLATLGGAPPGTASARNSGRFAAVDPSGQFHTSTPAPGTFQSGQYGTVPNPSSQNGFDSGAIQRPGQPWGSQQQPQMTNPTQAALPHHGGQQSGPNGQSPQSQPNGGGFGPSNFQSGGYPQQGTPSDARPANSPFTGNVYEFTEGNPGFDTELPPPPSNTNQFAVPDSAPNPSERALPDAGEDESAGEFVGEFLRMVVFGAVAAIGLYIAFLVVSTIFGHFLSGQLKLMASLILAAAIPLLTALGENSKRERFEVVDKPYDRIVRVFVGTAIFSFGTAVLCAMAMSGSVVHELRTFPNWFMSDSQRASSFGDFNAKFSQGLANVVEQATTAVGMYQGKPTEAGRPHPPVPAAPAKPPAPTRPSTRARRHKQADTDKSKTTTSKHTGSTPTPEDHTAPKKSSHGKKDDEYIRW